MIRLRSISVLLFLVFLPISSFGGPVVWEFKDVIFDDSGTAAGSFTFNADTNTFSNISINTTTGSARAGATYAFTDPLVTNGAYGFFLATGDPFTAGSPGMIVGLGGMTNAGGSFFKPWLVISEGPYGSSLRSILVNSTYRQAVSGGIVSVQSVPEPSTLLLMACGGCTLILFRLASAPADQSPGS